MSRILKIKNFRNIGFKNENVFLLLNNSLDKDLIGTCLYLIGPNNSGKSNILQATEYFNDRTKKILDSDKPDFIFDENDVATSLELCCEDEKGKFTATLLEGKQLSISYSLDKKFESIYYKDYIQDVLRLISCIDALCEDYRQKYLATSLVKYSNVLNLNNSFKTKPTDFLEALSCEKNIVKIFKQICTNFGIDFSSISPQSSILSGLNDEDSAFIVNLVKNPKYKEYEKENYSESLFKNIYGYDFLPKIVTYNEVKISSSHLSTPYAEWESSPLLTSLFAKLNISKEIISSHYKRILKDNNIAVLRKIEKIYEPQMQAISDEFNKIYSMGETKYKFSLIFERQNISFAMSLGESPISLEKQSAGFKWFFNFFFNFMFKNTLQAGDILIMDEPCLYLHVHGIEEIREMFRDFAEKQKLTILISTHLPFFVSPDHFDDVRVVDRRSDKETIIYNNFEQANCCNKNDTLFPIVKAFTTYSSVIVNPDNNKVLVEGITDYNYLTAFKRYLNIDNIVFIPFNGVGRKSKDMEITCNGLASPAKGGILLVDADNSGKQFDEIAKKRGFTIKKLSDIDEKWSVIESLFTEDEKAKFHLMDKSNGLGSEVSSNFKKLLLNGKADVSQETKDNFIKLLSALSEQKD